MPTVERDTVPEWARSTPVMASQKQLDYIRSLVEKKDLSPLGEEQVAWLMSRPDEFWDERTTTLPKQRGTDVLEKLIPLKWKPRDSHTGADSFNAELLAVGVPAGRYAVKADKGELRFYNVWQSRDKRRMNVYVCHGPDESDLKYHKTKLAILRKIKTAGIRESAILYGLEIGSCSNCGRRLTNRISRALGIGPICGSRMFGGDVWKVEVKVKRQEMIDAGIDPDEEIDDDLVPADADRPPGTSGSWGEV